MTLPAFRDIMTVSTENAPLPKSTKSLSLSQNTHTHTHTHTHTQPESYSVSHGTNSNRDFGFIQVFQHFEISVGAAIDTNSV